MRVATSDGVELAVYDLGGSGPPLLLAHATGFHGRVWGPVVEAGLGASFRCYAFDERAHGDSAAPADGNFSWHRFGDDALEVLDALGLGGGAGAGAGGELRAVGHSCGGALLLLAEMARPGTFAELYCYEPVVTPLDEPLDPRTVDASRNPLAMGARRRREVFESFEAALENFSSKPPMAGFSPAALRAYVEHGFEPLPEGGVRLKCRGEDEARTYEAGMFHRAYQHLAEVQCPVTLVCGEHTNAFGEPVLALVAARLRSAPVEVMPGLSHFGPLEDPAAVADSILRAFSPA